MENCQLEPQNTNIQSRLLSEKLRNDWEISKNIHFLAEANELCMNHRKAYPEVLHIRHIAQVREGR